MKIAYIVSAYRLPGLLVRLVRRLQVPDASFLIHVDAKTPDRVYRALTEALADDANVMFLPRHACYWGDFGHVRATLVGLRTLIASGRPFDYVVLLTGQDYPIRTNAEIDETFARAEGRVFMRGSALPTEHWGGGGLDRIEQWHFRLGRRRFSFPGTPFRHTALNAVWSAPARAFRLRRRFPDGLRPYGGASYWCMPAACARYVDEFVRTSPRFVDFFRRVHVPDEIFFQTIVMNSPFRARMAEGNLHYCDWTAGGDHPKVLTMEDVNVIMHSRKLFARKFDPDVDAVVLDRIDELLDGAA